MVIDDIPGNIELIINKLDGLNYTFSIATNGQAGISIAKKTKPNLIIIDWEMPELDGIQATQILKNCKETCDIPIIIATGKMLSAKSLKTALESGANDYIRKPVDKLELIARIQSMILLFETTNENKKLQQKLYLEKEQKLSTEIENKKRELTKITLQLINNRELSNWVVEKLNMLDKLAENKRSKSILEIINKFKINNNNNLWKEFETTFEQVNKNFYKNLQSKYPDITQNEKKLCAFIKMNMTSKDISSITFQSIDAIKKARYRLRKKMNIEQDIDINTIIDNL